MINTYPGAKVRVATLQDTKGLFIEARHLDVRRLGAKGALYRPVDFHQDVWYVKHDGADEIAAYRLRELEEVEGS